MGFGHSPSAPFSSRMYFHFVGTAARGPQKVSPQHPLSPGVPLVQVSYLLSHSTRQIQGMYGLPQEAARPPGTPGPGRPGQLSAGKGYSADSTEEPGNPAAKELGGNQRGWAVL